MALPLGPLAADVSKQRSNRWQLNLARTCLHCLPILQLLASPRTAAHPKTGHSKTVSTRVERCRKTLVSWPGRLLCMSLSNCRATGHNKHMSKEQVSAALCPSLWTELGAYAHSIVKSCEGPLMMVPGHTCPAFPASACPDRGWAAAGAGADRPLKSRSQSKGCPEHSG